MKEAVILVLEDDADMRSLLIRGLREEDFEAEGAGTATELLQRAEVATADAFIIDIGLPDADGRDVCQALRARGVQAPVLFLTARTSLPDRLSGFSAGGDDFLSKPFAFAELIARLQALIRRGGSAPTDSEGRLRVDPAAHTASWGDASVALTPTEFRLLARLAAAPGEAVRRRELIQAGWPHGAMVHDNTLDAYLARLRRKLASLPSAPSIRTVERSGVLARMRLARSVRGRLRLAVLAAVAVALAATVAGFNALLWHSLSNDATSVAKVMAVDQLDSIRVVDGAVTLGEQDVIDLQSVTWVFSGTSELVAPRVNSTVDNAASALAESSGTLRRRTRAERSSLLAPGPQRGSADRGDRDWGLTCAVRAHAEHRAACVGPPGFRACC